VLLRQAEVLLRLNRFDEARAAVAEAQQLEPGGVEAGPLLQRIRSEELRYLSSGTVVR
jgi:hypothetical protein